MMGTKYEVAIQYQKDLGYVTYDEDAKSIVVTLANDEGKKRAEDFLAKSHVIGVPQDTIRNFKEEHIEAKDSLRNFQLVMTRLWETTDVHVDWSRPIDYVKAHPRYD